MKRGLDLSALSYACVVVLMGAGSVPGSDADVARKHISDSVARSRVALCAVDDEADESGTTALMKVGEVARHKIRFAASGQLRFVDSAHVEEGWPPELDIDRSLSYYRGETLDIYWTAHRQLEFSHRNARSELAMKSRFDLLVEATGWWPAEDTVDRFPEGYWAEQLLHVVIDNPRYKIAAATEDVDGHPCVVLRDEDRDIAWLGIDVGYAVVRREQARREQIPFRIYRNSSFQRVGPNAWFPMRFSRELYSDRPSEGGKLFGKVERTVSRVLINESLSEDVFRLDPPPGTVVLDLDDGRKMRRLPGGEDLLDETAATVKRVFSKSLAAYASRETFLPKAPASWLLVANGVLMAVNFAVMSFRWRPRRLHPIYT